MTTNKTELYAALSYNPETDFETIMMESMVDEAYAHMMSAQSALESYLSSKNDTVESAIESLFAVLEGDDGEECECKKKCEEEKEKDEENDDNEEEDDDEEDEEEDAEESTLRAAYEAASSGFIQKAKASWKAFIEKAKAFFTRIAESLKNLVTRFQAAILQKKVKNDIEVDGTTAYIINRIADGSMNKYAEDVLSRDHVDAHFAKRIPIALGETFDESKEDKSKESEKETIPVVQFDTLNPDITKKALMKVSQTIKFATAALKKMDSDVIKNFDGEEVNIEEIDESKRAMTEVIRLTRKAVSAIATAVAAANKKQKETEKNKKQAEKEAAREAKKNNQKKEG